MMNTVYNKNSIRIITLLLLVSGFLMGPSLPANGQEKENITLKSRGKHKYAYNSKSNFGSFSIDYRGEIELTDNEKDIKSISPGGYFKVVKTTFGTRRVVQIENKDGNQLIRTYRVGRNEEQYYPDGQKWLADILPDIIRNTGLGAVQRVARIFKKSGTNGVLSEISAINGDYVKSKYFTALLDLDGLPERDLPLILSKIGSYMSSAYEMGKLLGNHSHSFMDNEVSIEAFFQTTSKISSDYEKSKLLIKVLDDPRMSDGAFEEALLTSKSISSDFELSKVLRSVLNNDNLSNDRLEEVIEITDDISSDFEKSGVLQSLVDRTFDDAVFDVLLSSFKDISSDFEKSKLLKQVIDNQDLNNQRLRSVLNAIDEISSSFEKQNTLVKLIDDHEIDGSNIKPLLEIVDDMSSAYEQSNIYKRVIEGIKLSDENMILLLTYIENISSNHEKTNILIKIADEASKRGEKVKSAFMETAKSIHSDHSYGSVMRAFEY